MGPGTILVGAVVFGVIVLISKSIRVVQQAQTMIVERLGKYHKTLGSGINFIMPVIDKPRAVDWHQTVMTPAG
ncbi:MAG TPA: SPFH domain-containing protein, partial [Gammaproteobacteria bacterium]|nr:SPFH domain-containing protein [Gammaproteobacteria bacterium]